MKYHRMSFGLSIAAMVLAAATVALGQVDTGTPAFASFGGGPFDTLNLGNLNDHLVVPIVNKPGRGIPFRYAMAYDSSVFTPVGALGYQSWQPAPNWGWTAQTQVATGYMSYSHYQNQCPYYYSQNYYNNYTFYSYVDNFGSAHQIGASVTDMNSVCGMNTGALYSVTYPSNDGSGFTFTVSAAPSGVVNPRAGGKITPPLVSTPSFGTVTDSNGNQISANSGGTFTDTLGTTALTITGAAPNPVSFAYSNPPGVTPATSSTVFNYTNYSVHTNFSCPGISEYISNSVPLVSSIVLADNTSYSLSYETTPGYPGSVTGRIASVTLPTGGTITYGYSGANYGMNCADGSTLGLTRTTSDSVTPWTYTRSGTSPNWTTTVLDPSQNQTILNFQASGQHIYETKRQSFQGTGTLLQTVNTCYNGSAPDCSSTAITLPITRRTVYPQLNNGLQSKTDIYYGNNGLVTETDEYDFGNQSAGGLLRKQLITYANPGNYISDRVASVTVQDGSGAQIAQVTNSYDGSAVTATTGVPQHIVVSGARANLTSVAPWLNTGSIPATSFTYDDTGNVLSTTDSGGHTTSFGYSSSLANGFVTQVTMPDTGSPVIHHTTQANYDINTGLQISSTDLNNQTTSFTYEKMWRPASISYPDGGQTTFSYPDGNWTETKQKLDAARWTDQWVSVDNIDRLDRILVANANGTWDERDICYDNRGQTGFVSYPYASTGKSAGKICSGGGDVLAYDALGRTTNVTHSDGTARTLSYGGRAVLSTEESNGALTVQKIQQSDALGRLVSTCEVSGSPLSGSTGTPSACRLDIAATGFLTSSAYDLLDNLTLVQQPGLNNRSYNYDSLSRLTAETAPESGTASYTYNGDGLLLQRVRPASNQTNPNVTLTASYGYDALHRLTSRTYSDTTPSASFFYDDAGCCAFSPPLLNTNGQMVYATSGQTIDYYGYDPMGRLLTEHQAPPQIYGSSSYALSNTYDLAGNLTSQSNGKGVTLSKSYDSAGQLSGVTSSLADAQHPATLLSNATYNPFGLASATLGNGITETRGYAARGWLQSLSASSAYNFSLGFAANGNITSASDSANGNWSYGYDALNRLATANKNSGQQAFAYDYDRFGNRWNQRLTAGSGGTASYSFDANNRIVGSSYDAVGNLLSDGFHSYTYDAENRMISVDNGGTASYVYDALGRRVKVPAGQYLYDSEGHAVTLINNSGMWLVGEIFAAGRHLATYNNSTTTFNHPDWLGSERARTDVTGAVAETCGNLPFGDGQTCTGSDPSLLHFTGDERDTETGLDHTPFRQYQSLQGRWLSVDPLGGDISNPQSLNRYAYVQNDPNDYSDPSGAVLVQIEACGLSAQYRHSCPNGDWLGIYFRIGPWVWGGDGGGGGGGGADGSSTGGNSGSSAPSPSNGPTIHFPNETNGLPKGMTIHATWVDFLLPDQQCEFGVCGIAPNSVVPGRNLSISKGFISYPDGYMICGDFICAPNGQQVGIASWRILGLHDSSNIIFMGVGLVRQVGTLGLEGAGETAPSTLQQLFGKGTWLNSGQYWRIGFGRNGGVKVFRSVIFGWKKDWWTGGPL